MVLASFNCTTVLELWDLDCMTPLKDPQITELIRGAFFYGFYGRKETV